MSICYYPDKTCEKCLNKEYCEDSMAVVEHCIANGRGGFKPQTNADRIRNMSDEELARFIHDQIIDRNIGVSLNDWLDWLREEAADGAED